MLGPFSSGSSALLAGELRDGHTNAGRHRLNVGAAYDQIPTPDQKRNAHIYKAKINQFPKERPFVIIGKNDALF